MKRLNRFFLILLICLIGCGPQRPPIPPGIIPEAHSVSAEDEQYGHEVLNQLVQQFPLDQDDARINRARRIVDRIAAAAHADRVPWNVFVLHDDHFKNAAATRGNYVFVWTGIMSIVQSDAELATILSHEISHVLANHTQPTPSETTAEILSGSAGSLARNIVAQQGGAYGLAADFAGMLIEKSIQAFAVNPEQQRKEFEADQIGIFLMADAGYNPEAAVRFWDRVRTDPDFSSGGLQFLSTHPSSDERLIRLEKLLPQAMDRYRSLPAKIKPKQRRR